MTLASYNMAPKFRTRRVIFYTAIFLELATICTASTTFTARMTTTAMEPSTEENYENCTCSYSPSNSTSMSCTIENSNLTASPYFPCKFEESIMCCSSSYSQSQAMYSCSNVTGGEQVNNTCNITITTTTTASTVVGESTTGNRTTTIQLTTSPGACSTPSLFGIDGNECVPNKYFYIVIASIAFVLILIFLIVSICCCKRKQTCCYKKVDEEDPQPPPAKDDIDKSPKKGGLQRQPTKPNDYTPSKESNRPMVTPASDYGSLPRSAGNFRTADDDDNNQEDYENMEMALQAAAALEGQEIYGNQEIIDQVTPADQETVIDGNQEVYGNQEIFDESQRQQNSNDHRSASANGHQHVEEPYMDMDVGSNTLDNQQECYEAPANVSTKPAITKPKPALSSSRSDNPPQVVSELQALMAKMKLQPVQSSPVINERPQEEYAYTSTPRANMADHCPEEAYADNGTYLRQPSGDYGQAETVEDDDNNIYQNIPLRR